MGSTQAAGRSSGRAARVVWAFLTGLVAVAGLCLAFSSSSLAGVSHEPEPVATAGLNKEVPTEGPHGEHVPSPGKVGELNAMTVDDGSLWIAEEDPENKNPTKFRTDGFDDTTGAWERQLAAPESPGAEPFKGVAVGHLTGEQVYVGSGSGVIVYGASGKQIAEWKGADCPGGSFKEVNSVAVDDSSDIADPDAGDVYVYGGNTVTEHFVDVFKPEAGGTEKCIAQLTGTGLGQPFTGGGRLAVDPANGDVLVGDNVKIGQNEDQGVVDVFEPEAGISGAYKVSTELTGSSPSVSFAEIRGLAVDGGTGAGAGDVYVATTVRKTNTIERPSESGVYEFRPDGAFLDSVIVLHEALGNHFFQSVAVDSMSGHVFVGERRLGQTGKVYVFGPTVIVPDVVTEETSNLVFERSHTWGLFLRGSVNPEEVKAGSTTCQFVWGTTREFGNTTSCSENVPESGEFEPVHVKLTGLEPDRTYYYRLQASNADGTNLGEESQDQEFTTPGPGLESESVLKVTESNATLQATIAPHDQPVGAHDLQVAAQSPTSYYFQYSTGSMAACDAGSSPCPQVPLEAASIGSGTGAVSVEQELQGLQPGTVYHYRVVAENESLPEAKPGELYEFYGPDRTFVTQPVHPGPLLPDGRAWELVSPAEKYGSVLEPIGEYGLAQAAAGGDAMTYLAHGPTEPEPEGNAQTVQLISTRGAAGGWSSVDIATPHDLPTGTAGTGLKDSEYRFFSEDLTRSLLEPLGKFTPIGRWVGGEFFSEVSPEATEKTPYVRSDATCQGEPADCYEPLLTGASGHEDVPGGTKFGEVVENEQGGPVEFVDATPDASDVVLQSQVALTENTPIVGNALYEWSAGAPATERLQPVSVLSAGEDPAGAAVEARIAGYEHLARNAISDDGSRIFFTADGHLYMRDMTRGETVRLDVGATHSNPPNFQGASVDGSKAFFTDTEPLTKNSGAHAGVSDLYECEIVEADVAGKPALTCDLSDLTPLPLPGQPGAGESADVLGGVAGISEDGDYVYFTADGVLAEGAKASEPNLYMLHYTGGAWEAPTLVATLSSDDAPDWGATFTGNLVDLTARVSPDGEWLAFMSDRSLTGYDNLDAKSGEPDEEVYLYHATTGKLVCASCDPSGARPLGVEYQAIDSGLAGGNGVWPKTQWLAASVPGWTPYGAGRALHQSRYLSDEGRLFFNSSDKLVPQDTNGDDEDVYEYEPAGVGGESGCGASAPTYSAGVEGCVGLISSGIAFGESAFLDASANGDDVFFLTREKLVERDVDTALDVYDAHVCSAASPCANESLTVQRECRSAAECRVAQSPEPSIYGAPSSATFAGAGNVTPAGSKPATTKAKSLTRAQKLARALQACKRDRSHKKRVKCERGARKRYGPVKPAKTRTGKGAR